MLFGIVVLSSACIMLDALGVGSFVLAPLLRVLRVTRFLQTLASVDGLAQLVGPGLRRLLLLLLLLLCPPHCSC